MLWWSMRGRRPKFSRRVAILETEERWCRNMCSTICTHQNKAFKWVQLGKAVWWLRQSYPAPINLFICLFRFSSMKMEMPKEISQYFPCSTSTTRLWLCNKWARLCPLQMRNCRNISRVKRKEFCGWTAFQKTNPSVALKDARMIGAFTSRVFSFCFSSLS